MMSPTFSLQLMLIDPDDDLQFLLKVLLEVNGFHVETSASYTEALARTDLSSMDVIFTELELHDDMGLAFGKHLRSMPSGKDPLLVALTSSYYQGIDRDVQAAGFDAFILKPIQFEQILNVLRHAADIRGSFLSVLDSKSKAAA